MTSDGFSMRTALAPLLVSIAASLLLALAAPVQAGPEFLPLSAPFLAGPQGGDLDLASGQGVEGRGDAWLQPGENVLIVRAVNYRSPAASGDGNPAGVVFSLAVAR